jgi:hypothetical protein
MQKQGNAQGVLSVVLCGKFRNFRGGGEILLPMGYEN